MRNDLSSSNFDYEAAIWGEETIYSEEKTIAGFRLKSALELLPDQGKILEVGCGAGRFLRGLKLEKPEYTLTGIDISRHALRRAAEISPTINLRLAPIEGHLPAPDEEFDAAVVFDVLEHVDNPQYMLNEIYRVLVPHGIFHLHVPCEGDMLSLWRWLPNKNSLKRRFGGHIQRFRRSDILRLLDAAGFDILSTRYSLHLLGNLADVAIFVAMECVRRWGGRAVTTGTIMASASGGGQSSLSRLTGSLIHFVDNLLWLEAKLLARVPSWGLSVSCRKRENLSGV